MATSTRTLLRRGGLLLGVLALLALGAWRVMELRLAQRCESWLETGRTQLADGTALAALDALGRAVREPACGVAEDARVWFDYANARIRVRDFEAAHVTAALSALQRARTLAPTDREIGTALAEALLGAGFPDEAVVEAERVLAHGEHAPARRVLAAALLAAGRTRELIAFLDDPAYLGAGFWFRATRLLVPGGDPAGREAVAARVLGGETDPGAAAVLRVLVGGAAAPGPEALLALLAEGTPSADVLGTTLLLLEQRERPDLMLELLVRHRAALEGPLRRRAVALAWQDDRRDLLAALLDAGPLAIHETPELVLYGALAGHGPSLAAVREVPLQDTAVARAWRTLARGLLDAAPPTTIADASSAVLRDAPGSALALAVAAEAWLRLGELQRAEGLALRAMRAEPFWAQPRLLRGIVRARRTPADPLAAGPTAEAPACTATGGDVAAYRRCARAAIPAGAEPWQVLLVAVAEARRAGDLAVAGELVAELRALSPTDATLWRLEQARTLLAGPADPETVATAALRLREVLDVLPRHAEAHLLMGLARVRLRDPVGGRTQVVEAVTLEPRLWRDALRIALLAYREEASPDAPAFVELAGRVIARAPLSEAERRRTEETLLRGLVTVTADGADPRLERAAYARLVELSPRLDFALNNHAWLLYEAREGLPLALAHAERAVALRPDEPAYADTLAAVRSWRDAALAAEAAERARVEAALEAERSRLRARAERVGAGEGAAPTQVPRARNSSVEFVRG